MVDHNYQRDAAVIGFTFGEWVVVAFTKSAPVGVDVEQMNPNVDVMKIEGVLTDIEIAQVMKLPNEQKIEGFLTYWTRKEAVLKATGEGLMIPPVDITISAPNDLQTCWFSG